MRTAEIRGFAGAEFWKAMQTLDILGIQFAFCTNANRVQTMQTHDIYNKSAMQTGNSDNLFSCLNLHFTATNNNRIIGCFFIRYGKKMGISIKRNTVTSWC